MSGLTAIGPDLLALTAAGVAAALVAALLAPLGPLAWYAGWMRRNAPDSRSDELWAAGSQDEPSHYVVYLSGIGEADADDIGDLELGYLRALAARLPGCVIVHDIFSFAVDNLGLTEEHWLGSFWRWVRDSRAASGRIAALGNLINLRNLLQVLVSADRRYGPLYSWGTAGVIARSLVAHGYRAGSGAPVTLLGYSGGAQIALGAARYLGPALGAPLQLIALGGVMSADPGLDAIESLHLLTGTLDPLPSYGARFFPGRWPIACGSPWNRARAAGKISMVEIGPARHHSRGGYFDPTPLDGGPSLLNRTVAETSGLVAAMAERYGATRTERSPRCHEA